MRNTLLPMTQECIDCIHLLAQDEPEGIAFSHRSIGDPLESDDEEYASDSTVDFAPENASESEPIESTGVEENSILTDEDNESTSNSSSDEQIDTNSIEDQDSDQDSDQVSEASSSTRHPAGTTIRRHIENKVHIGTVRRYDADRKYYWIEYYDGDSEELSHRWVEKYKCSDIDKVSERSSRTRTPSRTGATTGVTGVRVERERDKRLRQNPKRREVENVKFLGATTDLCTNEENPDLCTNENNFKGERKNKKDEFLKYKRSVKNKKTEPRMERKVARKRKSKIKKFDSDRKDPYTQSVRQTIDNKGMREYLNAMVAFSEPDHAMSYFVKHIALTQYGMKKGLQLFGERGVKAIKAEMQQFHDRGVVSPIDPKTMTKEDKNKALNYLMFLKEKRCGKIKGRGCADGRRQSLWYPREKKSAPTVMIESVFLTCAIDAKEQRDVATVDIPGAFLQAKSKDHLTIRLDCQLVEALVKIDKNYEKYVTEEKGVPVIYGRAEQNLYGCVNVAMNYYELFVDYVTKELEFELNPYDRCVANKMINGKLCTILWWVDDLKISHKDADVVSDVIEELRRKFGQVPVFPLTETRGLVHDYLGMIISFEKEGEVKFTMYDYLRRMFEELPTEMVGTSELPALAHLFQTNDEDPVLLGRGQAEEFHHLTAKLLFLSKRARPDISTAVAFLCTRVRRPDMDDRKKLGKVMMYLQGTAGLPLIIGVDDTSNVRWYIDGSFTVHNDMRGHTGISMTMGKGSVYSSSRKQKLNSKSSSETEVIGVDDGMNQVLWTKYFLQGQSYDVKYTTIKQDNKSSILLEENGKMSSTKNTRHILIRYYFICDVMKREGHEDLQIEWCPTLEMWADFYTKPLAGELFQKMRRCILGIKNNMIVVYNEEYKAFADEQWKRIEMATKQRELH